MNPYTLKMPEELMELYEHGASLFDKGNYVEAEGVFKQIIRRNPNYADVLNKLGIIANLNGRLKEAAGYLEKAVSLNPSYTEAVLNLTITYNEMGETDRAAEVFEKTARETDSSAGGKLDRYAAGKIANEHLRLGNIYYDFGLVDEAVEEYRKALKLCPDFPDIRTKLGVALRDQQLFDDAISELAEAKRLNERYGPALVQLGLTYYMKGLTGFAFEEWEEAIEKVPDLKEAQSLLNIFRRKG
jgi:tetratricopeptide (TPR) repeat protein